MDEAVAGGSGLETVVADMAQTFEFVFKSKIIIIIKISKNLRHQELCQ